MSYPTVAVTIGPLVDATGTPYANTTVHIKLDKADIYQGFVVADTLEVTTGSDGIATAHLFPNHPTTGLGSTGSVYSFKAFPEGGKTWKVTAQVPNTNCSLSAIANYDAVGSLTAAEAAQASATASAAAASGSATAAAASASAASTSATNAASSASTATTQASSASTSAGAAATSASTASTQASNAATSASGAAGSATSAANSATAAAASASSAASQASNAAASASDGAANATNAAASAASASTSAANAANSATAAAGSATSASGSATSASGSASAASTSASSAATSATNAAASASSAAATLAAAELSANKDTVNGYVGLSSWSIKFRNLANTFTSFLRNAATAARIYTFPDRDITVAGVDDITGNRVAGSFTTVTGGSTGSSFWSTTNFDAGAGLASLVLNSSNSAGGYGRMVFRGGSTKTAWMVSAQNNVDNGLEITPSTAAGGTTFTTPVVTVKTTGINITGDLSTDTGFYTGLGTAANSGYRLYVYNGATGKTPLRVDGLAGKLFVDSTGSGDTYLDQANLHIRTFAGTEVASFTSTGLVLTGTTRLIGGNANTLKIDNGGQQYTELDFANNGTVKASLYWDNTTPNLYIGSNGALTYASGSSSYHAWNASGTELMRLNGGSLGIGVTPAAWAATNIKVLQASNGAFANNGGSGFITNNASYEGGGAYTPTRISASYAQMIAFNRGGANDIQFLVAGTGAAGSTISWTQAATIDSSANLTVNGSVTSTTSGAAFNINQGTNNQQYYKVTQTQNTMGVGLFPNGNAFLASDGNYDIQFYRNTANPVSITATGLTVNGSNTLTSPNVTVSTNLTVQNTGSSTVVFGGVQNGAVTFGSSYAATRQFDIGNSTAAGFSMQATGQGSNQKIWDVNVYTNQFRIGMNNDANTDSRDVINIARTGYTSANVAINFPVDISASTAGQIKFPATQNASSNANTLDDYSEGTWTPTDGSGASLSFTINNGPCTYVKVGQFVYASFDITWPSTASSAGAVIASLPYAVKSSNPGGAVASGYTNLGSQILGPAVQGSANIVLYAPAGSAITNATMSTKRYAGVLVYQANA